MPRKKTVAEPITGTGNNPENKLTIQKSLPLFSLWRSDMSLAEFKILDTYLSRINSHDPEKRTVIFTKGELEKLLGVKKINKSDLVSRLNGLGRFVDLEQANNKKIHQIALFEEAYGEADTNGLWTVKLTCTAKAMKYVFNIEKLGYLRYKLRCITSLTSRYTYVLFMYLESNRFRKTWEVDLGKLRQILNCDQDDLYQEFKFFNQRILKRCQKELLEKTECRYVYEPVKSGRTVVAIRFTLETQPDFELNEVDPDQISFDDLSLQEQGIQSDSFQLLQDATGKEFTQDQITEILQRFAAAPDLPDVKNLGQELTRYHWLTQLYAKLNTAATRAAQRGKPIRDRYKYFLKLLDESLSSL